MKKLVSSVFLLLFFACSFSMIAATTGATSISFDSYSIVMSAGGTYTIKVTTSPSGIEAKDLVWSSDDARVATVYNGVITSKVNGGCIITASDPNTGASAKCYVGVGAPYGYTYYSSYDYIYTPYGNSFFTSGYSSGYYPISTYPYTDVTYPYSYSNYPYGYYGNYTAIYPYGYPYQYSGNATATSSYTSIPVYYNYADLPSTYGAYINQNGQIVYSVSTPSPVVYIPTGTARNASEFSTEVKQGVEVRVDDEVKGFGYVDATSRLVIVPDTSSKTKTNQLQIAGNVLNRLEKFNFSYIQYNLPNLEITLNPLLNRSVATVLKVTMSTEPELEKVVQGPWNIEVNSEAKGLGIRFVLDKKYAKSDLKLMKLDKDGAYVEIDRDDWYMTVQQTNEAELYAVNISDVTAGCYAVVQK